MGFKRTQTIYTLEFDGQFAGLEVKLRRGSIRERMDYEALGDWKKQVDALPQFMISWNVTDDDTDEVLPMTAESLWSLEEPVLTAIVNAYTEAIYPNVPLDAPSTDGAQTNEPAPPERDLELEESMQQMAVLAS
ncbi:hypothetical protein [Amycolatopsis sp. NPDC004378]